MATIYEIAEKAGVPPKTAARILSGETKRSKKKDIVLEWAAKLGYVPNAAAANLRTGRSKLVGILVPHIDNPFYTQVIQGFHDALGDSGFQMLVACSFGQSNVMIAALRNFESYGVDAIVFNGSEGRITDEGRQVLRAFQAASKPVILVGREAEDGNFDQAKTDNVGAIASMVLYLKEKGHRKIGFIGGDKSNRVMGQRFEGFQLGAKQNQIKVENRFVSFGDPGPMEAGKRALAILSGDKNSRPTAIICANDIMAMGVIKSCRSAGISVPGDVAVTGFDDIDQAALFDPGITTLKQPISLLASDCVSQILSRLETPGEGQFLKTYLPEIVVRESA